MKKLSKYVRSNKIAVSLIAVLLLFSIYSFSVPSFTGLKSDGIESSFGIARDSSSEMFDIRTGYVSVDSDSAVEDLSASKDRAKSLGGSVENENIFESEEMISVSARFKIPTENFDIFIEWINENYEVESSNVDLTSVDAGRLQNEIGVLLDALDTYNRLLDRAESLPTSAESISAIQQITQAKLNTIQQLRAYGYDLEELGEREDNALVTVTFNQDKPVNVLPEDLGREFMLKIKEAVAIITGIATGLIVLFALIIKWVIYGLFVAIPLYFIYRVLKKNKKKLF